MWLGGSMGNPENIIFQCQRLKEEGRDLSALAKVEGLALLKAKQQAEDRADLERVRLEIGKLLQTNTHP